MKVNGNLSFYVLGSGELQNAIVERLSGAIGGGSLPTDGGLPGNGVGASGRLVYNTDDNLYYFWNGTSWGSLATGGAAASQAELDLTQATIGDMVDPGGSPNTTNMNALSNVSGAATISEVLSQLDIAIANSDTLGELNDVTDSAIDNAVLVYDFGTSTWVSEGPADARTSLDVYSKLEADTNFLDAIGDNLISGSLTIDSGASLDVVTGGGLTIADAPTSPIDAANKSYVDSVGAGLDPKESVRISTTGDIGGTYAAAGGPNTSGEFTLVDIDNLDGVGDILIVGDRILVKDQTDAKQNGIYFVTVKAAGALSTITRAEDQDGTPANEVSGGNHTYVENGSLYATTGWVLAGDGNITLNTDNLDWVQFSAAGTITAINGVQLNGTQMFSNISNLAAATIVTTDRLTFSSTTVPEVGSEGGDRNILVSDFINDLGIITAAQNIHYIMEKVSSGIVAFNVNHALNQRFCNVTITDEFGAVLIPEDITMVDANNLTVTLNEDIRVFIIVTGIAGVSVVTVA